ncbi:snapalysin family zinc-dependent metalloprotease [Streptomyces sp. RKND-216]|uniref:snapalysin family zinc-dependent metalloprotease n=1 Tax=Streptomyces sp. RKND-216 TaxID=2562581 RepID=UPI00109DF633|nr:snapalysin family zinc-dependent metalloprotease [Streptomyces sp. RKND-216]THA24573.1 snapalysin family zinc-dependent metalloprotease [Streptomyces sp. RKND-216]
MRNIRTALAASLAVGMAVAGLAAAPASVSADSGSSSVVAAYEGGAKSEQAQNRAFFEAVWEKAQERQDAKPGFQAITLYYNDSAAPSFQSEISQSASIWNSSVSSVTLAETSGSGDFDYREGNDPRGSYASTDGRGHGYIFLDYAQNETYDSLRVTSHETGHVLGLPDNYSGPCSELMSGGGPGPSCTNAYPNSTESARVDQIFG